MSERRQVVGRPDFTAEHLEQLRRVDDGRELARAQGFAPRSGPSLPNALMDLSAWRLIWWDAGARVRPCRTLDEKAPLERTCTPQHIVTHAGRIVLALAQSLDGTAPPSELSPGAQKETEGDT